jgi:tRNA (mo5U34)-methyltransferase
MLFEDFFKDIQSMRLAGFQQAFLDILSANYHPQKHGDFHKWTTAFNKLPEFSGPVFTPDQNTLQIGRSEDLSKDQHQLLLEGLRGLMPWRKGPFNFFGHTIDTEWRSDLKWQRVKPHIAPLSGRLVLDVGCGSGYHCWRMLGEGARFVLGIDPSVKFVFQFNAVKKYTPLAPVYYLPLRSENLPANLQCFDTVFSMGVIYHRRSPFDHIDELKASLRPGGELILETLVIPGNEDTVLTPADRYAQMRNVWFIGSNLATMRWLQRCGLTNVRMVDETITTPAEQRKTNWMTFNSLTDFLNPFDNSKTMEGYPAPRRAIFIANKPY